jgi:hypothetical protein
VRENLWLRDAGLPGIDPGDGRRIEVVATGLPVARGIPVAVDATLVSPLHADGTPFPGADSRAGVSFKRAERSKATTYPELVNSSVLQLVTVASETGGRLNRAGCSLLADAAVARARTEPAVLRKLAARGWRTRWTTLVSVSVQSALAATLVNDGTCLLDAADGPAPLAVDVWLNARATTGTRPPADAAPQEEADDSTVWGCAQQELPYGFGSGTSVSAFLPPAYHEVGRRQF